MSLSTVEQQEQWRATGCDNPSIPRDPPSAAAVGAGVEFSRFRVLRRPRQLLADGVSVEIGTRAFDLLLVLLEADGALVTKDELLKQVWRGIVVADENLKVQISALRRALGQDRDLIRTEFGRGYRFIADVRPISSWGACQQQSACRSGRSGLRQPTPWRSAKMWCVSKRSR
jgi:DNA-binding winged helix-turn-helix (wHTH) protein